VLHIAAGGSIEDLLAKINLLLQKGADVFIEDNNGKTALDLARERGYDDSARYSKNTPAENQND
jgi:ankyrin repeat protein